MVSAISSAATTPFIDEVRDFRRTTSQPTLASLLAQGAQIDAIDCVGRTALHHAVVGGDPAALLFLLQHKPSLNIQDQDGNTSLNLAVQHYHFDMVKILAEQGADVNIPNRKGMTPFNYCCEAGPSDRTDYLFYKRGADVDIYSDAGPLDHCFARTSLCEGEFRILALEIILRMKDIDKVNGHGDTPLLSAVKRHYPITHTFDGELPRDREVYINELIGRKANINARDRSGCTSLFLAAKEGHRDLFRLFLKFKADLNQANNAGETPVEIAAFNDHKWIVQMLLIEKVDVPEDVKSAFDAKQLDKAIALLKNSVLEKRKSEA